MAEGFVALGISPPGIPFGGSHVLTSIFFLLGSIHDRSHLRTLARLTRMIADPAFVFRLRQAENASDAYDAIVAKEAELD
jgi:PTS system nitrogen regulatory IIA component